MFCFSLRALSWRVQFPDAMLSKARVVMAWVSKQDTVVCGEESHKQIALLVVWDVQTAGKAPWEARGEADCLRQSSRSSSIPPKAPGHRAEKGRG